MPPWDIEGLIIFAYVHSQMNPHMCVKFGAIQSSRLVDFPDFNIFDHLTPPLPECPPGGLERQFCLAYAHSQINPHMLVKFGANRSTRLVVLPDF